MRRRSAALVGVAVIAALLLSACTSDGSEASSPEVPAGPADPIPVLAEAVVEAGEPISDGFTVPEGAVLLGRAIPKGVTNQAGDLDRGWDAYLVVPGDPRLVVRSLIEQAEGDGFAVRSYALASDRYPSGTVCGETDEGYRCSVVGFDPLGAPERTFEVQFVRAEPAVGGVVARSWLRASLSDAERPEASYATEYPLPEVTGDGPVAPDAPREMVLPEVGDAVGEEFADQGMFRFRIEEGSEPIGPVLEQPGGGRYTVLLAVDGDLDDVVARYLVQHDGREFQDPVTTDDGTVVRTYGGGGAGGSEFLLRSVQPPDGPPVLRLEVVYG